MDIRRRLDDGDDMVTARGFGSGHGRMIMEGTSKD